MASNAILKVLVVDDFESFRRFVLSILQRSEFQVIEALDGLEAIQKAKQLKPDLILLDIGIPKLNGLEVARSVRKLVPPAKILFLSQESSADVVQEALNQGALGYVHKLEVRSDLLPAIEAVRGGKRFLSGSLKGCQFSDWADEKPADINVPVTISGERPEVPRRKRRRAREGTGRLDEPQYPWQQAVVDAFHSPSDCLPTRLGAAERAIAMRLTDATPADRQELRALSEALHTLRVLLAGMPVTPLPAWQQAVVEAFQAPAGSQDEKINIAERVIAARLTDPNQTDKKEIQALKDGLRWLRVLLATRPNTVLVEKEQSA